MEFESLLELERKFSGSSKFNKCLAFCSNSQPCLHRRITWKVLSHLWPGLTRRGAQVDINTPRCYLSEAGLRTLLKPLV